MTKKPAPAKSKKISRERQLSEDWQAISRTPEGRRVIADLFAWGWVFQPIEENDPMAMSRANGERNFAIRVARYLSLQPEVFDVAMRGNDETKAEIIGDEEFRAQMAHWLRPGPPLNS
jgi:hypothetical protein